MVAPDCQGETLAGLGLIEAEVGRVEAGRTLPLKGKRHRFNDNLAGLP
jgi:hypothetical protein